MLVFLFLREDYPRLQGEFRPLATSSLIFLAMTIISAVSFYSRVIDHKYRNFAQAAMWLALAVTGWLLWP